MVMSLYPRQCRVCLLVYIYIYMYVCMYIYIYIYIYVTSIINSFFGLSGKPTQTIGPKEDKFSWFDGDHPGLSLWLFFSQFSGWGHNYKQNKLHHLLKTTIV